MNYFQSFNRFLLQQRYSQLTDYLTEQFISEPIYKITSAHYF